MNIHEHPAKTAEALSYGKAAAIAEAYPDCVVLGADTLGFLQLKNGLKIKLGKPKDHEEAYNMLKNMSGQRLEFYTGFTLIHKNAQKVLTDFDLAFVKIKKLSEQEIQNYIGTGEPFQAAGALISEQKGAVLIEKITGDPTTLIGLPLHKLHKALKKFGIQAF